MVEIGFENVSVRLGKRDVVRDISAKFPSGVFTGIIGPNGAGKSTLIRALFGLSEISSGMVCINGVALTGWRKTDLARQMAYLPQGQTLHWPITVERLVQLGRIPHQQSGSRLLPADQQIIEQAMIKANIWHLKNRIATELSGGERARALLARALAVNAPILIADEPLASLDPGQQLDVMKLLQNEAQSGKLVIAVLHDLNLAARFCDQLVLISEGQMRAHGKPDNVLSPDLLADVYGLSSQSFMHQGQKIYTFDRPKN